MNDRRTNALGSPSAEPSLHELSQGGKLNEKESIELIARMISETKSRFEVGDGNILLSWGILTATIATVVWAAVAATGNPAFNGLWALMAFGWFFNRRLAVKQSSRAASPIPTSSAPPSGSRSGFSVRPGSSFARFSI